MKPTYIGYSTQPYVVIMWRFEKYGTKPTYCYSETELQKELARYRTPGDLYYQVPHNVHYLNKMTIPA